MDYELLQIYQQHLYSDETHMAQMQVIKVHPYIVALKELATQVQSHKPPTQYD